MCELGRRVHIMHIVITPQLTDKYITPLRAGMQIPQPAESVLHRRVDGNKLRQNVPLHLFVQLFYLTNALADLVR